MYSRKKKPCGICRRWFAPKSRVQRVCSSPDCQRKRKRRQEARWRASRPDYFIARRILKRAEEPRNPSPLELKAPLNGLPWDVFQDEVGVAAADFLAILVGLILRMVQTQEKVKLHDTT